MPLDATAISRFKDFKFRLEINGLPAALVREFNPGDRSHGITEHAGAGQNMPYKEVGMIRYGNATLRNVLPIEGPGKVFFENWMNLAQDPTTGDGGLPKAYQKNFSLYELMPDGSPGRTWEFKQAFPVRYNIGNKNAMSDNADVIEELEIAYTRREMRVGLAS